MSRILFCWELGLNTGHIRHITWLARQFSARGHDVAFCLKDVTQAQRFLGPDAQVWQAPLPQDEFFPNEPLRNYTDILRHHGFSDYKALNGLVSRWQAVFHEVQPDLVVADHAPTALLAARCSHIPAAAYGIGFLIPPLQSPMPEFCWWQPSPPRVELRRAEREVLTVVNRILHERQCKPLDKVADVLDIPVRALTTVPPLDDYRGRPGQERYYGFWDSPAEGIWPGWPTGSGPRILGYLRAAYSNFEPLVRALGSLRVRALIHVPDCSSQFLKAWPHQHIRLCPEPLNVQRGAQECDAAVCYASYGFVADVLAQGKPLLVAPPFVQQAMVAQRVLSAGAGVPGEPFWKEGQYREALTELIENKKLVTKAEALAALMATYPRNGVMEGEIVSACEALL